MTKQALPESQQSELAKIVQELKAKIKQWKKTNDELEVVVDRIKKAARGKPPG